MSKTICSCILLVVLAASPAFAWPDQAVKIVAPFTPGTGPDIIARFVAERLSPKIGQPVVVENVTGASGDIGSQQVARARPDGHTLMSSVNTLVMNASLFKRFDRFGDTRPAAIHQVIVRYRDDIDTRAL